MAGVYLFDVLKSFVWGGLANFVDSESDTCRIWSPTGLITPHPLPAMHCLYILYFDTRKGGGVGRVDIEKGKG
jgi:hypothetical protein